MSKRSNTAAELAAALHKACSVCVISHYNPDADALGSSLGLTLALIAAGKKALCLNESTIPERYHFLPGIEGVAKRFDPADFDLVCVLDCGELNRVGDSFTKAVGEFSPLINIDHHITNDLFGTLNIVEVKACSTSELVFDLLCAAKITINKEIATCLYAGICGDTGSFRYASTSKRSFEIASELTSFGAVPHQIADAVYGNKPLAQVKLESLALAQLTMHEQGKICEVIVTQEMYEQCGASVDDTEFLVETARDIKGVQISALIKRDADLWKVSLRASGTKLDMSSVAQGFGGGGHRPAAAFRWRKSLEELRSLLMVRLKEQLQKSGV